MSDNRGRGESLASAIDAILHVGKGHEPRYSKLVPTVTKALDDVRREALKEAAKAMCSMCAEYVQYDGHSLHLLPNNATQSGYCKAYPIRKLMEGE